MALCAEIGLGGSFVCPPPSGGTRATIVLYDIDNIEGYTEVSGKITAIDVAAGKYGYKFSGGGSAFKNSEVVGRSATTGMATYKHSITFVLYERTQAVKDNLAAIANGRFVAVLFLNGLDADSIVLAGKNVGLELAPGTIRDAFVNDGLFVLNLKTPDGDTENEIAPMQSVYVTDRAATIAMIDATLD